MQLSAKNREKLARIIIGDNNSSPYRSGPKLVDFFRDFGEDDLYDSGFPSRLQYTKDKLEKLNGTDKIPSIISEAFDFFDESALDDNGNHIEYNPEALASNLNKSLIQDGFRLSLEHGQTFYEGNKKQKANPFIIAKAINDSNLISSEKIIASSISELKEHQSKISTKINDSDYSGAITNCYSLIEELLKHLLRENNVNYKETNGDIKALYATLKPSLNLDPKNETIDEVLKPVLSGLTSIVSGIYSVANSAGDRHAKRYRPSAHMQN